MYLLDIKSLKIDLASDKVSEKDLFTYFSIAVLVTASIPLLYFYFPNPNSHDPMIEVIAIATTIIALVISYILNGASNGKSFINRYIPMWWVCSFRGSMYVLSILAIGHILEISKIQAIYDDPFQITALECLVSSLLLVWHFSDLRNYIAQYSGDDEVKPKKVGFIEGIGAFLLPLMILGVLSSLALLAPAPDYLTRYENLAPRSIQAMQEMAELKEDDQVLFAASNWLSFKNHGQIFTSEKYIEYERFDTGNIIISLKYKDVTKVHFRKCLDDSEYSKLMFETEDEEYHISLSCIENADSEALRELVKYSPIFKTIFEKKKG